MWDEIKVIDSSDTDVKKYVFQKRDAVAESVLETVFLNGRLVRDQQFSQIRELAALA